MLASLWPLILATIICLNSEKQRNGRLQRIEFFFCFEPGGEFEDKGRFCQCSLVSLGLLGCKVSGPSFIPLRRLFIHSKKKKKRNQPSQPPIQQLSSFLSYHHPPVLRGAAQTVIDLAWSPPTPPPAPAPPTPSPHPRPPPLVMNMRQAALHRFLN